LKAEKETLPDPPEWVSQIVLARAYGVLPSAIDDEPMEWVAKMVELFYQENKQGIRLWQPQ